MTKREEVIKFCKGLKDVYEDYPFKDANWTVMRHKDTKKVFAWIFEREENIWINLKCDPETRDLLRGAYESVIPAYHLNKEHWNSVILNNTVPEEEIKAMIIDSYERTKKK